MNYNDEGKQKDAKNIYETNRWEETMNNGYDMKKGYEACMKKGYKGYMNMKIVWERIRGL